LPGWGTSTPIPNIAARTTGSGSPSRTPRLPSLYAIPGPTREGAIAFYEAAGSDAVNGDLLEEGIAAELAFLVSAAEVAP
jgi:hypothetical protein